MRTSKHQRPDPTENRPEDVSTLNFSARRRKSNRPCAVKEVTAYRPGCLINFGAFPFRILGAALSLFPDEPLSTPTPRKEVRVFQPFLTPSRPPSPGLFLPHPRYLCPSAHGSQKCNGRPPGRSRSMRFIHSGLLECRESWPGERGPQWVSGLDARFVRQENYAFNLPAVFLGIGDDQCSAVNCDRERLVGQRSSEDVAGFSLTAGGAQSRSSTAGVPGPNSASDDPNPFVRGGAWSVVNGPRLHLNGTQQAYCGRFIRGLSGEEED